MSIETEIIQVVQNEREKLICFRGNVDGLCQNIREIAEQYHGCMWWSDKAKGFGFQQFSGHAVGVIPSEKGTDGFVIDFTHPEKVVIGQISDIHDNNRIAEELQKITTYAGWVPRRPRK